MSGLKGQKNDNTSTVDKVVWMVSIGRNPDFVGRSAVISTLESKLAAKPDVVATAVLCGLGGVGYVSTQLPEQAVVYNNWITHSTLSDATSGAGSLRLP